MTIKLQYQDRHYFHPAPTPRMVKTITQILSKFGWQIDKSIEELTRDEAKELCSKGIKAAKRKGVRLSETEIDKINQELTYGKP